MNHPYFPQDVEMETYSPNATPLPVLLGSFGGIIAMVLAASLMLAKRIQPGLQVAEQLTLCWFLLSKSSGILRPGWFGAEVADLDWQADSSTVSSKDITS